MRRFGAFVVAALMIAPLGACVEASPPGSAMTPPASAKITTAPLPAAEPRSAAAAAPVSPSVRLAAPVETVTTVGPKDTIYSVAREHNVPIRDLIQWNGLDAPYDLKPGQVLRLPASHEHVVAGGDTVYSISRRYNVDMTTLMRTNGIEPPYKIAVGEHLKLPLATMTAPPPAAVAPQTAAVQTQPVQTPSAANEAAPAQASPATSPAVEEVALTPPAAPGASAAPAIEPEPRPAKDSSQVNPSAAATPPGETPSASAPGGLSAVQPESKPGLETAALPVAPVIDGETFMWPLKGPVLSAYGPKKGGEHNDGINIAAKRGTPVRAAADGTVIYAGNELRGFGNLILIKHSGGWTTAYAHNDSLLVSRGAQVKRGQVIAKAGSTGSVTAPQLHFEIRRGTRAVNPADYLTASDETATRRVAGRDAPPDPE